MYGTTGEDSQPFVRFIPGNDLKTNKTTTATKKNRVRIRSRNRPGPKETKRATAAPASTHPVNNTYSTQIISKPEPNITTATETNCKVHDKSADANTNKTSVQNITAETNMQPVSTIKTEATASVGKTREQVMAEREAKKLAKQAKKQKPTTDVAVDCTKVAARATVDVEAKAAVVNKSATTNAQNNLSNIVDRSEVARKVSFSAVVVDDRSRDDIKADREAKKLAKQLAKTDKQSAAADGLAQKMASVKLCESSNAAQANTTVAIAVDEEKKKPVLSKAERRAIQEAQRAAKAHTQKPKLGGPATKSATVATTLKSTTTNAIIEKSKTSPTKSILSTSKTCKILDCNVKLFSHLERARQDASLFVNNTHIHPAIARLGEQYAKRTVVGSNARCIAFLKALKIVIQDFETPPKKEFARSLDAFIKNCVEHLHKCRPLAVSVSNAYKHIKQVLMQLPTNQTESELKQQLCHFIQTYVENQIGKAALAISSSVQKKISDGDVILTFACSSLIYYILEEAHRRQVDFRVVVVDSRPFCEGQELLRRLCAKQIPCSYVLINAVSFVMPEVTKVLLGAHALLSNGYVMARAGTAQVAMVARSCNVPVLVCCETHKFSERFQTDAIVYNELGNPDDLVMSAKCCLSNWQSKIKMSPLNLNYDITPPELVTGVVTEVSILPCTSVPVILRLKPTEIGYIN